MAKKSKAARARAKAITRIQQQHPRAGLMAGVHAAMDEGGEVGRVTTGGPTALTVDPQTGDPWAEKMVPAYLEVQDFERDQPDVAAAVRAWGDDDVVDIVLGIAEHDTPLADGLMMEGAAMLRRWAIMHKVVWMYDWPIPIAALSDEEIVAAILLDKADGVLPTRRR